MKCVDVHRLGWFAFIGVWLMACGGCAVLPATVDMDAASPGALASETDADDTGLPLPDVSTTIKDATLGPGDEISVVVYRHNDLNRVLHVPESGTVFLPLAGEMNVLGVSAREVRGMIAERLSQFIVDPQVNVTVSVTRSQKVTILGEVLRPGVFSLTGPTTVIELLGNAGGFNLAGAKSKVYHLRLENGETVLRKLNIERALKKGELDQNVLLAAGDIVYVPPTAFAEIDRFARHVATWLTPVLQAQQGILLGLDIDDEFDDDEDLRTRTDIVITTPPIGP